MWTVWCRLQDGGDLRFTISSGGSDLGVEVPSHKMEAVGGLAGGQSLANEPGSGEAVVWRQVIINVR